MTDDEAGASAPSLPGTDAEKRNEGQSNVVVQIQGVTVRPGDWLYADADGIVVHSRALH